MTLQDTINQHLNNLPINLRAEVLDFVLFLEQKYAAKAEKSLAQMLTEIPAVGRDEDFDRIDEAGRTGDVFD
jgi:hypothetical protein